MRLGERGKRGRLAGAGDADHADDAVRTGGGLVDEHPLLARQVVAAARQRLEQRPSLRVRHGNVAAGERQLDRLPLEREQVAAREPRWPPRDVAVLDQLDAREARQLIRKRDHLLDALTGR